LATQKSIIKTKIILIYFCPEKSVLKVGLDLFVFALENCPIISLQLKKTIAMVKTCFVQKSNV